MIWAGAGEVVLLAVGEDVEAGFGMESEVWGGVGAEAGTETGVGGIRKPSSVCLDRGRSLASREAENPLSLDFLMMSVGMAGLLLSSGFSGQLGWVSLALNAELSLEVFFNLSLSSVLLAVKL